MLIMNEKEFIYNIIHHKSEIPKNFSFKRLVFIISEYFSNEYNILNKETLYESVIKVINNLNIEYYIDFKYDKTIRGICDKVIEDNIKLKIIEYIPLYDSELELINTLTKDREKKLLFTCYIISRFYNTEGWVNITRAELFKLSNVTATSKDRNIIIGKLIKGGYLFDAQRNDNLNIKVNLLEGEEVLRVKDLENIGNQFISFSKKDYIMCENCGRLVKIKSNRQMYCKQCFRLMELEKYKKYNEKR
ncbi:MAG: hypothetical protein BV457_05990 [Thermoplasmata archaeon M9B1D]|nr:MAG: hypothetical protein BV457_05990 [Thermoplasmata archaeon M9B1D]